MPSPSKEQLAERLRPFEQEHLLRFWDDLSTDSANRSLSRSRVSISHRSRNWFNKPGPSRNPPRKIMRPVPGVPNRRQPSG